MISFEKFTLVSGIPIYLQIIMYVKRDIIAGNIKNYDEMPSRRVLSALLGVNPNTVQKAYKILEDDGLIQSHSGAKSCVCIDEKKIKALRSELVRSDVQSIILSFKQMGMSKIDAVELIEKYWE